MWASVSGQKLRSSHLCCSLLLGSLHVESIWSLLGSALAAIVLTMLRVDEEGTDLLSIVEQCIQC